MSSISCFISPIYFFFLNLTACFLLSFLACFLLSFFSRLHFIVLHSFVPHQLLFGLIFSPFSSLSLRFPFLPSSRLNYSSLTSKPHIDPPYFSPALCLHLFQMTSFVSLFFFISVFLLIFFSFPSTFLLSSFPSLYGCFSSSFIILVFCFSCPLFLPGNQNY